MSKFLRYAIRVPFVSLAVAALSIFVAGGVNAATENAPQTSAKSLEFDSSFLNVDDVQSVDLSRFAEGASGLPGIYKTALYVND